MRKGFTLLELLIVVIIIGILAAIAIPQFFKVAERARASEGVNVLGAVKSAQLRYYAEHGHLATGLSELDAEIGQLKYFQNLQVVGTDNYDPTSATRDLATIDRNNTDNPGYGNYTLHMHHDGSITCAGGTKCPAGF